MITTLYEILLINKISPGTKVVWIIFNIFSIKPVGQAYLCHLSFQLALHLDLSSIIWWAFNASLFLNPHLTKKKRKSFKSTFLKTSLKTKYKYAQFRNVHISSLATSFLFSHTIYSEHLLFITSLKGNRWCWILCFSQKSQKRT